jgi:hypothetical protein
MEFQEIEKPLTTPAASNGGTTTKPPQDKPKKARRLQGIPTTTALSSMASVSYNAHVAKDPVAWDVIENYQVFSPAADGSRLMIKVSKSKSVDLKTRRSVPTGYGQAYPVELSVNPTTNPINHDYPKST